MAEGSVPRKDHVLIFPFLAKGHIIPLLRLASALSSRNILVTLITTPGNATFFRQHIFSASETRLALLPMKQHPEVPSGVECTDSLPHASLIPAFMASTASLSESFAGLLPSVDPPPLCLVSDFFLGWTLPICSRFGLPRLVFHGMSAFSMSICKSLWLNVPSAGPVRVGGAPANLSLNLEDVPDTIRNSSDLLNPETQFLNSVGPTDVASWGVLVNSFAELEPPAYVRLLESFYGPAGGGRAWLVGPLGLLGDDPPDSGEPECLRWLDQQPAGSVVYAAFGSQAMVSDEQLDEVARGLVRAGFRFLWAVRSSTWEPPPAARNLGRIERGWVPQKKVLCHVAIGGFLSHCGWNSVLEAVAAGVPLLAFPMIAEQGLNAKMVADEIGVALRLPPPAAGAVLGGEQLEEGLRELMEGCEGQRAREKVRVLADKARQAVVEGGSSYQTLDRLLEELRMLPPPFDGASKRPSRSMDTLDHFISA